MFWGLTPALDLLDELEISDKLPEQVNILLVGGGDGRHVLKTISKRFLHSRVKLHFFLMEACPETIAKQLLLLYTALQPSEELGLVQKTRYFMELYGNTVIRPAVANYLTTSATEFVKMITNLDHMKQVMPQVKLELKYKERDYIENVFHFWYSSDSFDICDCWDKRLRKHLGPRYDSKKGAFDWDLHMRYHHVGGGPVCNQEYQSFRLNGTAFSWLESEVSKSNRSMVCGVIGNGKNFAHYGYLGEMETGPFVAFGLDCEDKDFLKMTTNNTRKHRSTDITERNLRQIFYEIENQQKYVHLRTNDINLGGAVTRFNNIKVIDSCAEKDFRKTRAKKCIRLDDVAINFMSIDKLTAMKCKEEFKGFFDLIYFNSTYLKYLDCDVIDKISKTGTLLIIENQIFVLSHREKQLEDFEKVLLEKLSNLRRVGIPFNVHKDYYAKFMIHV